MNTEEVLDGSLEAWNAHDRDRWVAYAADSIEVLVSGGVRASGPEGAAQLYDTWHDAFPDNRVEPTLKLVQGANGTHESHLRGRTPRPCAGLPTTSPRRGGRSTSPSRHSWPWRATG